MLKLNWNVASGQKLRTFSPSEASVVSSLAFSADGKILASGRNDDIFRPHPALQLSDVRTGEDLRTLIDRSDGVLSVAFSADGKTLANGSRDRSIKLWDVASGRELRTLTGHSAAVSSVAFSADGKTLASGSADHTIKLWDVLTGGELRTLKGHDAAVTSVSFLPDRKMIVSSSADSTIKLWRTDSDILVATLISLDKDDWVIVTPEGLFDASPGARKLLHYVLGFEVVTLDQMKDLYYVPGLLQRVIRGEPLPKVQLFTAQDLFPEAEYQQPKARQQTFTITLRNRGGGIGPTQVLVNGTEVIADARPLGFDPQAKEVVLSQCRPVVWLCAGPRAIDRP